MTDVVDLTRPTAHVQRLRNGEMTSDPRLDRVHEVDLRSLNFPITTVLKAEGIKKPRSYSWRVTAFLDQGNEGACVGFGWAHELAARPAEVPDITNQFARQQIYWEAQRSDEWPGGAYPGATPFYEGSSVLAGAKIVQKLGYIDEYRWALSLDELVLAVGYKGPAVIGVTWHEDMRHPDEQGFIRPTGPVVGGHCICVYGVKVILDDSGKLDPVASYFKLHNSWGEGWGIDGRCSMSVVDMAVLWPGGDFCIPLGRTVKPTPDLDDQ